MTRFLEALQAAVLAFALLLCLALGLSMVHYRTQARVATAELTRLQAGVKAQNTTAKAELDRLTAERDTVQAQLDAKHQHQEKADAAEQQEIARLRGELERRPVRVRIVAQPVTQSVACGPGSGGAAGEAPASADPGAADTAEAYGLLPAGNSARLGAVIQEIETLNAAYTSCRTTLIDNNP